MTEEICLVEVSVRFVKSGELDWSTKFGNYSWETEPQTEPVKPSDLQSAFWGKFQMPEDIYFTADNCRFSFRTFGQGTSDEWSNPFDWLIDAMDIDEIFQDWLPDLKKLALFILGESNKKKFKKFPQEKPSNYVNFVTAWRYWVSKFHGINGVEYEEEWELIGAVNLEKMPFSIMKMGEDNN